MRRALVLCILTGLPSAACVPPLPGGSLGEPNGGSAGSSAPSSGGAGAGAAGSNGMGGRPTGSGGGGHGTAAIAGPGTGGMGGSQTGGRSSGPGTGGFPGCAPPGVRLASDGRAANIALNIAVDSESLFWVQHTPTSATLVKVPVSGGEPVPLASVNGTNNWVAVDASGVYWSDAGSGNGTNILKVGFDGGTPTMVVASQDPIIRFAIGADGVYWTTGARGVMKAAFGGGAPTMLTPAPRGGEIVVDAANVYWIRGDTVDTSSIMKVANADGTDPIVLAQGQSLPVSLALDGQQYLYWVNQSTGVVMRVPIDGSRGPEVPFLPSSAKTCNGIAPARSVAVDATGVYWTDLFGNVFAGVPGQPMNARLLAGGGSTAAFGIVLDATSAYWMTPADIFKVAK